MRQVAILLLVSLGFLTSAVHAHSEQRDSVPADGAQLEASPEIIEIGFDGPMRIISVTLTSNAGAEYDVEPESGRNATERLRVAPPRLPAGDYVLEWRGLAADGHAMSGALGFSVLGN